ncbi:LytR/AlgR family response regulator transcription factor [Flavobacterium branchiicola]|uniref:LytR/AlgR family response regulator transcription factor n=1 Tax=Flavobacterium branchiicola TaxID=1114875 RepID=A0ABV9PIM9_9FLAO|nr:LytTR family DNA-binding domain-containing protein [Flavobacterium branchiicola]MBS7256301.1 response regulator transcription factor [Flavobacterium branchiicola]
MNQIRTLIIEDEPAIRKELQWLVSQEESLKLEAMTSSVKESLQIIKNTDLDLVLMDIQLTDGTAFDILNQLEQPTFHIIFITAYNHFAIKAIKYGALDYLLKPIDSEEFTVAIQKVKKIETADYLNQLAVLKEYSTAKTIDMSSSICITSLDCMQIVRLNEIVYLSGEGSYTQIHLENKKIVTASKPLKYYEDILPSDFFIKTHQSYIVNKNFIDKYMKTGIIIMKNSAEIPVATRRKEFVMDHLNPLR